MKLRFMTLARHIIEQEKLHPEATGELSKLLSDLSLAAKVISLEVNKAGLAEILGFTGDNNAHGGQVKKLDSFGLKVLCRALGHDGHLSILDPEEDERINHLPNLFTFGKYFFLVD